ncbi:ABC transporter permease [Candidatus Solirubrobacter pratensis]|uniref:ABC transporter permease n=1 Tax=Candidatus Solirubrobacter pratensis TaxID=1298857 RepID=UPI00041352FA|nr:ABC transporter permease [Candidatus Solirubrobacter pratensis]
MTAQLRSELLKLRTTRTTLALLGWMLGLVVLIVALHLLSFSASALAREGNQLKILGLGTSLAALFAALLGALSITGELRTGTIRPTLLITPRRTRVVAAKVVTSMLAGAAVGLLAEALTAAAEAIGLAVRGIHVELGAGDYAQLLAGGALSAAFFGAIGAGAGAVVRGQVAAVTGLCVWLLLVEPLLLGDVPSVAKYAPEASAGAVAGAIQGQLAGTLVAPGAGAVLLAAYAALAALAGAYLITRRDVG